jgi:hypothetical protein
MVCITRTTMHQSTSCDSWEDDRGLSIRGCDPDWRLP